MTDTNDLADVIKRIKRRQFFKNLPKRIIPPGHWGDVAISFLRFLGRHKRLPRAVDLWNNHIFRFKVSGELSNPLRRTTSDKEDVKTYVDGIIGAGQSVPTLAVITDPHDLATFDFPDNCCIKPTHSSGQLILRRNGAPLDYEQMVTWFYFDHYLRGREANYRYLTPKIIVEPLLFDDRRLLEVRFYSVNGQVRGIWVETGRFSTAKSSALFDLEFNHIYQWIGKASDTPRPDCLEAMLAAANSLAADFNFMRVDMYTDGTTFYVGELTSCDGNALAPFPDLAGEALASQFVFAGPAGHVVRRS